VKLKSNSTEGALEAGRNNGEETVSAVHQAAKPDMVK
jgi:hypothetical protein